MIVGYMSVSKIDKDKIMELSNKDKEAIFEELYTAKKSICKVAKWLDEIAEMDTRRDRFRNDDYMDRRGGGGGRGM